MGMGFDLNPCYRRESVSVRDFHHLDDVLPVVLRVVKSPAVHSGAQAGFLALGPLVERENR